VTGNFFLDWATLAVSLFNTFLLLWLGLTVLLNAERRSWGVWLAGGGLLMGGAFFISHTAILGHGSNYLGIGVDFWWHVGWAPVVISPLAWYVAMLWYAGFWDDPQTPLRRRQRFWFPIALLLDLGLLGMLAAGALPSFWQVTALALPGTLALGGIPLLILIYPVYIILCIALSLDALRRPEPSARVMGDLARRRARPWLIASSLALFAVSLLVALVMLWVALTFRYGPPSRISSDFAGIALGVAGFDLVIATLIGLSVILLGQAIVSYEIFTGKALPRRGFFRHWRSAVILAAGYSALAGWSLTIQLRPVYSLLLSTLLVVAFYALFGWRSFTERERNIAGLRPFIASQRLYERLLTPSAPPEVDAATPFRALCEDVLGARVGYLAAVGPLAPLVGAPLTYPSAGPQRAVPVPEISQFDSPQTMCVPLDPARYEGAVWAVPLWSERGLIGALLLGEKRDGGLYTQEEIEIARASGERLIDTQASAEMARRLMALQRERLAHSQVLDRRARRVLHDDVLPRLHAALLTLNSGQSGEVAALLTETHRQIADLLHDMPATTAPEVTRWGLVGALRQIVGEELGRAFDEVTWQVEPQAEREAHAIPSLTAEVLFYAAREAIRNAARHGRGENKNRPLHLRVGVSWDKGLQVTVEDDGVGLTARPAGESGSQGLALHSTMMAIVGGTLAVDSLPGTFTRVTLALPQGTQ
jgi:signal transduction histidine kinase